MSLPADHEQRMQRARQSLLGLSVGDAFGQTFFRSPTSLPWRLENRYMPAPPWYFTDDTAMALSIVEVLDRNGCVDQDELAQAFARRYALDPGRGYGPGAMDLLHDISRGGDWRELAPAMFNGDGSLGNGAAMRVAPLGAYFADDVGRVAVESRLSSEVTHAHPDGIAGGIAIAVAAATAWQLRDSESDDCAQEFFNTVLAHTPDSSTRNGIETAQTLALDADVESVVLTVGNGDRVTSADTVPFCLWSAARHLTDYEEAMWTTVSGYGDRDTTCAIVGGIVALADGDGIPPAWAEARETI